MAKPMSKIIFEKYDADRSGKIDAREFRRMCYDMGHFLDDEQVGVALQTIGGKEITYDQFIKWWRNNDRFKRLEKAIEQPALQSAVRYFQWFDKDHSGALDRNEFKLLHADLVKSKFTTMDYNACLKALDENGDGSISFNEYLDWLHKIGSVQF